MPKPSVNRSAAAALALAALPAVAGAFEIAPHRAVYRMTLASTHGGQQVADVTGRMLFEWGESCDAWLVDQKFLLRFLYVEGGVVRMQSSYETWEAKDGLAYRFKVRKLTNGVVDEEYEGSADLSPESGGTATYRVPELPSITLDPGTLFPTAHTLELLRHAEAGDVVFGGTVFDGSDAEAPTTDIVAAIGRSRAPPPLDVPDGKELATAETAWPVRLAFFDAGDREELPKYEMGLLLLANGVAPEMLIDYGDFTVRAVLEGLEAMPKPDC